MPPDQNKKAMQEIEKAFNTGDLTIVDRIVDAGHKDESPIPGTSADRDGLKAQIQHFRQAFPNATFKIEEMVAEGETVAYRWTMEGTQQGTFEGYQPAHGAAAKKIRHFGQGVVRFKNGKMVSHQARDGIRSLLSELGHEPIPRPERDPDLAKHGRGGGPVGGGGGRGRGGPGG
jgi:predicted ester cyclase